MLKVLTAEQMREVDRLTTERYGIPSILLMENAAHAVARVITEKLGGSVKGKSILIMCGKGNNGGDGAALARILGMSGAFVDVALLGRISEAKGDAHTNLRILGVQKYDDVCAYLTEFSRLREIETVEDWENYYLGDLQKGFDVFVDALFGTGLRRPLQELARRVVHDATFSYELKPILRVAIDIPSGLLSDAEEPVGESFEADITITFTAPKAGNVLALPARQNGELVIESIGSPRELIDQQPSQLFLAEEDDVLLWLDDAAFSTSDYKNKRGHTLIIAGSDDYSGAAVMCGNSAMRSGVGLTTLLVPASCKVEVASRVIPEVIVRALAETDGEVSGDAFTANAETIRQADSILVGPGLKTADNGIEELVREIVENRTVPVIIDAGALWFFNPPDGLCQKSTRDGSPPYKGAVADSAFLAESDGVVLSSRGEETSVEPGVANHPVAEAATPLLRKEGSLEDAEAASMRTGVSKLHPLILTPHEGEFLRLLGSDDKEAIKDRVAAVRDYAVANGVILVLKGERVLIASPDGRVVVNPTGNSGLGKAGNGDTLAGILAGFIAQAVKFDIDIFETVVAAVYVAGMAGDVAEKKFGKRVMTASDVRECLVDVFADLSSTARWEI